MLRATYLYENRMFTNKASERVKRKSLEPQQREKELA